MEPTLFDDAAGSDPMSESSAAPSPTSPDSGRRKRPSPSPSDAGSPSLKELKSSLKLDLNSPNELSAKKQLLQTPDIIQRFILQSPDLEKFLTQGINAVATPTPTKVLYPVDVTPAQRQYAQGFIDALNHIQQLNGFVPPTGNPLLSPGFLTPLTAGVDHKRSPLAHGKTGTAVVPGSGITVPSSVVLVQSPTRATATDPIQVASMIMQTMSGLTNNFAHGTGLMPPPQMQVPFTAFDQSSLMSSFHLKREAAVVATSAAATSIANSLVDDRPPSQKDPNNFEFTALGGASVPSASSSAAAVMYQQEQTPSSSAFADALRPSVVTTSRTALPARSTCRQDDHLVPNVTLPPSTATSAAYPMGNQFDMDEQDRMKLERKRARNRTAATKCRQRKIEKIGTLEQQVEEAKDRSAELKGTVDSLRKEITAIQQRLQTHRSRGCELDLKSVVAMSS